MKRVFTFLIAIFSFSLLFGQAEQNFWQDVAEEDIDLTFRQNPQNILENYRSLALDLSSMKSYLKNTAPEFSNPAGLIAKEIVLKMKQQLLKPFGLNSGNLLILQQSFWIFLSKKFLKKFLRI